MANPAIKKQSHYMIFFLSWMVYAFAYFARVNISILLPQLQDVFGWTTSQIGIIGSGFFWIYGIGHFVNGYIGDKISGRWYVFLGALLIAISNLLAGLTHNLLAITIIWSLHGFFQSMIWGPMIRILTNWFNENSRGKVATLISTSMIGGYFLAWGLVGPIISTWGWKFGFWIPGITILFYSFFWLYGVRDFPNQSLIPTQHAAPSKKIAPAMPLRALIQKTNLFYVIIACISKGIVKEGIILWGPLFIMERQGISLGSSSLLILLIPAMNLLGILFTGWLTDKIGNNDSLIISIMFVAAGLACYGLILFDHSSLFLSVMLLGIASAVLHGANTILLGSIPMTYKKVNRTSAVAGILDSISYIAAGISVPLSGLIIDHYDWNGVLLLWTLSLVGGILAMIKYRQVEKNAMLQKILTDTNLIP